MYEVIPITWRQEFLKEIEIIYKSFKDQERKIFDATFYEDNPEVLSSMEDLIKNNHIYIVKDDNDIIGTFVLNNMKLYKGIIVTVNIHCAIRRIYWGDKAREVSKVFLDFLHENYKIKKLIAEVPQCGYGIIKLLKDLGFKHEGTLKECMLFKNKNNQDKWYDKLIYSITRKDI